MDPEVREQVNCKKLAASIALYLNIKHNLLALLK